MGLPDKIQRNIEAIRASLGEHKEKLTEIEADAAELLAQIETLGDDTVHRIDNLSVAIVGVKNSLEMFRLGGTDDETVRKKIDSLKGLLANVRKRLEELQHGAPAAAPEQAQPEAGVKAEAEPVTEERKAVYLTKLEEYVRAKGFKIVGPDEVKIGGSSYSGEKFKETIVRMMIGTKEHEEFEIPADTAKEFIRQWVDERLKERNTAPQAQPDNAAAQPAQDTEPVDKFQQQAFELFAEFFERRGYEFRMDGGNLIIVNARSGAPVDEHEVLDALKKFRSSSGGLKNFSFSGDTERKDLFEEWKMVKSAEVVEQNQTAPSPDAGTVPPPAGPARPPAAPPPAAAARPPSVRPVSAAAPAASPPTPPPAPDAGDAARRDVTRPRDEVVAELKTKFMDAATPDEDRRLALVELREKQAFPELKSLLDAVDEGRLAVTDEIKDLIWETVRETSRDMVQRWRTRIEQTTNDRERNRLINNLRDMATLEIINEPAIAAMGVWTLMDLDRKGQQGVMGHGLKMISGRLPKRGEKKTDEQKSILRLLRDARSVQEQIQNGAFDYEGNPDFLPRDVAERIDTAREILQPLPADHVKKIAAIASGEITLSDDGVLRVPLAAEHWQEQLQGFVENIVYGYEKAPQEIVDAVEELLEDFDTPFLGVIDPATVEVVVRRSGETDVTQKADGGYRIVVNPEDPEWITNVEDQLEELLAAQVGSGEIEAEHEILTPEEARAHAMEIAQEHFPQISSDDFITIDAVKPMTVEVGHDGRMFASINPEEPDWATTFDTSLSLVESAHAALAELKASAWRRSGGKEVNFIISARGETELVDGQSPDTLILKINVLDSNWAATLRQEMDVEFGIDRQIVDDLRDHITDASVSPELRKRAIPDLLFHDGRDALCEIIDSGSAPELHAELQEALNGHDQQRINLAVVEGNFETLRAYGALGMPHQSYGNAEYAIDKAAELSDLSVLNDIIITLDTVREDSLSAGQLLEYARRKQEEINPFAPAAGETVVGAEPAVRVPSDIERQIARDLGPVDAQLPDLDHMSPEERLERRLQAIGVRPPTPLPQARRESNPPRPRQETPAAAAPAPQPKPPSVFSRMKGWVIRHKFISAAAAAVGIWGLSSLGSKEEPPSGPERPVPGKITPGGEVPPPIGPRIMAGGPEAKPTKTATAAVEIPGVKYRGEKDFEYTKLREIPPTLGLFDIMTKRAMNTAPEHLPGVLKKGSNVPEAVRVHTKWLLHMDQAHVYEYMFGDEDPTRAKLPEFEKNKEKIASAIDKAVERHNVPPEFREQFKQMVWGVIGTETGGNPNVKHAGGAKGLMAMTPEACRDVGADYGKIDEIEANVDAGVAYLLKKIAKFGLERMDVGLMSYNWGEGNFANFVRKELGLKAGEPLPPVSEWDRLGINVPMFHTKYFEFSREKQPTPQMRKMFHETDPYRRILYPIKVLLAGWELMRRAGQLPATP